MFWSLFALSLAIRLLVLGVNLHHPKPAFFEPDSTDYIRDADDLAHGNGLRELDGSPSMRRPPGYSGWLAMFFAAGIASPTSPTGAVAAQMVLAALSVALAAQLAFWLAGARAALVTGLLMAFEPSCIASSDLVMSETLYTFGLLCAFTAWWRWLARPRAGGLAILAACIGLLPLIRPAGIYLPFVFALLVLGFGPASSSKWRSAALLLALALIPVTAWRVRNFSLLGSSEVSSIGPWVEALFARSVEAMAGDVSPASAPWSQDFAREQGLATARALELQHRYFRETLGRHPVLAARRVALNALVMAGAPNDRLTRLVMESPPDVPGGSISGRLSWLRRVGPLSALLVMGMVISLGGIVFLPVLALRARTWDASRKAMLAALITIALYQWGISSLIQYQADRYRIPMIPLLAISLVVGILGTFRPRRAAR